MKTQKLNNKFKLTPIVRTGFGMILTAMAIIGLFSVVTTKQLKEANEWVAHTWEVKSNLNNLERLLVQALADERGFLITGESVYRDNYLAIRPKLEQEFQTMEKMVENNTEDTQMRNLEELENLSEDILSIMNRVVELTRQGQAEEATQFFRTDQSLETLTQIEAKIDQMQELEDELLAKRTATVNTIEQISTLLTIGGTLGAIALGLIILTFVSRKVVQPINEVSTVMASSSSEIAATVEQQERTATQQATAVNQTTTTMEELEASSQQSARQAKAASDTAQKVLFLVNGNQGIEQEHWTSNTSLREKVGQIAQQILQLSEQTNQIGTISSLVSDLANQTNMLALNAAVEAVRAGEHGKGFAVVAAEIRKLADQSRKSAENINVRVSDIRRATDSTVMVAEEGAKTVDNIVNAINEITVNNQQISLTAQQQAVAVKQVVEAMNSLNENAHNNASGITQIKVSIQQLKEAALNLTSVV
ncbi:MAG: methyl-accepting chemotaxis protein [Chroococcales cyanobacterium]